MWVIPFKAAIPCLKMYPKEIGKYVYKSMETTKFINLNTWVLSLLQTYQRIRRTQRIFINEGVYGNIDNYSRNTQIHSHKHPYTYISN